MAYYIFLKSLRSLEESKKNPHVKIPPKSPSSKFQSLGKFKNPIFNSEILFPYSRPGSPCGPPGLRPSRLPLAALLSRVESNPVGPASPRVDGASVKVRFPFLFTPSRAGRLSLVPLTTGPRLSARPHRHRFPATERRPAPRLGCHRAVTTSPSFPLP
jgi:hypothetical protein